MGLLSTLHRFVARPAGKLFVGGAAVGIGGLGTAAAQEGRPPAEPADTAAGATVVEGEVTPIDVEGEEILVPVSPVDDVLGEPDTLDEEVAAVELEPTPDTPVSPDSPDSPDTPVSPDSPASPEEQESPATVEAAEESPVTPDTPASPETAEEQASPVSPASPASP